MNLKLYPMDRQTCSIRLASCEYTLTYRYKNCKVDIFSVLFLYVVAYKVFEMVSRNLNILSICLSILIFEPPYSSVVSVYKPHFFVIPKKFEKTVTVFKVR